MKKGFTIVEIIISISIILIVGISTTFFIFNNESNNELDVITKEILEAANAYIKVEKDKNGNIYANEIVRGAKGVQIPLSNLVNSGYIKEEMANVIYKNNIPLLDSKDYYIMFVQENEEQVDYCDENEITAYASWIPKGKNIYLCDNYTKIENCDKENLNIKEYILSRYGNITKPIVGHEIYRNEYYVPRSNGLYYDDISSTEKKYFYVGNVTDNYVSYKVPCDTIDLELRILEFNDKYIKLVTEESRGLLNISSCELNENNCTFSSLKNNIYSSATNYFFGYKGSANCGGNLTDDEYNNLFYDINFCDSGCSGHFGLLNNDDLIQAGVPNDYYADEPNNTYKSSFIWDNNAYPVIGHLYVAGIDFISNNYLSTGGSTSFLTNYSLSHYYLDNEGERQGTLNSFHSSEKSNYSAFYEYGDLKYTVLGMKSTGRINEYREVIVLNINKFKFDGSGTKEDPYLLTLK